MNTIIRSLTRLRNWIDTPIRVAVLLASLATLLYTVGAPHEHGG